MFEKHSKVIFSQIKRDYLVAFFGEHRCSFVCFFIIFFLRFVSLGGFPLNMVVVAVCCGLF